MHWKKEIKALAQKFIKIVVQPSFNLLSWGTISSDGIAKIFFLLALCHRFFFVFFRLFVLDSRVARCFFFIPKMSIWVYAGTYFGGPWNGKYWNILWPLGILVGYLVYFNAIWYSLSSFGIFFPFWYVWTEKNLATLVG
jgi:hypothetical protein